MNEQSYEYRTGQTQPPKSSRGLIAFLLICIILLGGVVSVLGMMNIHLFRQLQQAEEQTPLSFAQGDIDPVDTEETTLTLGGITVQEMPAMYSEIYDLPAGLYVVDSQLDTILPGDVLTEFDGTAITTLEELNTSYAKKKLGDQLRFSFHRQGESFSLTIPFGN